MKIKKLSDKQLRDKLTKWIQYYLPEDTDIVLHDHSTQFKPRPPNKTMKRDICKGPLEHSYHDRILDFLFGAQYFYRFLIDGRKI